jgi:hypothetical protein
LKKIYGHLSSKQQLLLKTFAANFNKLLSQTLSEGADSSFVSEFLVSGTAVAQCCLPYGLYRKKLAGNCAKICAQYSKMSESAQMLSLQIVRALLMWFMQQPGDKKDSTLFEFTIKRFYNDFTLESRSGGGGFQVQDRIRVAQNCFVNLLGLDMPTSYQMGFLYIRQLCLHLRGIRNQLTKDGVKNIYSW